MVEEQKKKEKTPTTQAKAQDNAAKALANYYQAITDKNMRFAYDTLSWDMKNIMGTFDNFSKGYGTTISSTAENITLVSENNDQKIFKYQLVSKDKAGGNKVIVQIFEGVATMKIEDGNWHIVDMNVKKRSEHYE